MIIVIFVIMITVIIIIIIIITVIDPSKETAAHGAWLYCTYRDIADACDMLDFKQVSLDQSCQNHKSSTARISIQPCQNYGREGAAALC